MKESNNPLYKDLFNEVQKIKNRISKIKETLKSTEIDLFNPKPAIVLPSTYKIHLKNELETKEKYLNFLKSILKDCEKNKKL